MKRKTQILLIPTLTLGLCATTTIVSIATPFIQRKVTLNNIVKDTINLFKNDISKIYRETFFTRKIANWIKQYVSKIGFEVFEDNYTTPGAYDCSGNLYYDIPASRNCENWAGVTLQAHMDMVCSVDPEQGPYDWSKGVELVQEGNVLHSKNYKTSIGADNGVGLSLLLTLTKYHKQFTHGPIRVIFTADEEDGDSGASFITPDVMKYDNLINIDGETFGEITKCCAGTYNSKFIIDDLNWTDVTSSYNQYEIKVSGCVGGHSALLIETSESAIKIANEVLANMQKDANVELIEIVSENSNNTIASSCTFKVATNLSDVGKWTFQQLIDLRRKYPNEHNLNLTYKSIDSTSKLSKSLSPTLTSDVNYVIDKIFYGVKEHITIKEWQYIKTSSNIGPLILENNAKWTFETLIRSIVQSEEVKLFEENNAVVLSKFPNATHKIVETPCWEYKPDVPLIDLLIKSFDKYKFPNYLDLSHGWLECAFFAQARPSADIASYGFNIDNAHEPTETIHLDSIEPVLKVLLNTLLNINNK